MKKLFLILLLGLAVLVSGCVAEPAKDYSSFTTCVTETGIQEYGAWWCPNCNRVKLTLGEDAWKNLDYIECDSKCVLDENGQFPPEYGCIEGHESQTDRCLEVGIQKYPSWVKDGQILYVGTDMNRIAEISGCELPE